MFSLELTYKFMGPKGTRFAHSYFRAQKDLDFQGLPKGEHPALKNTDFFTFVFFSFLFSSSINFQRGIYIMSSLMILLALYMTNIF